MSLSQIQPREQNGRDSFARYRAQIRSAAIAALSILEGTEIDRVYCDLHDDYVVRKSNSGATVYLFTQVKTKGQQNYNWTTNDLFGLNSKTKDQSKQDTSKIKNSFIGKLLAHTVSFSSVCQFVVFQTNINLDDKVVEIINDIESENFKNKFTIVLIERFNDCYKSELMEAKLPEEEIKEKLKKLKFETDVQHLKLKDDNFKPIARNKIFQYSEIDLNQTETDEILLKLLELVSLKSSGVIADLSEESIEQCAAISINDLLDILSISKDAYNVLIMGGDNKAVKSASIIQRSLSNAGAELDVITYCSKCKTEWDMWLRTNRHPISPLDLNSIIQKVKQLFLDGIDPNHGTKQVVSLLSLRSKIMQLLAELEAENLLFDLNNDLILGGFFSELVRYKS